jgi:hypothetical protein
VNLAFAETNFSMKKFRIKKFIYFCNHNNIGYGKEFSDS